METQTESIHPLMSCKWTSGEDGPNETECGHAFEFTNDGISENGFKYCPFCGGHIKVTAE